MHHHQSINTALLSYGMSGEVFHGPLLNTHPGFHLSTILQRNSLKASDHFPDVRIVRRLEDIIEDASIELVVVNTPNETHFDYVSRMLKAGKHVVVEKPFTVTSKEADELITLAGSTKRVLTVFQNRRWDGDFLTVQKVIESNVLGKIVEFEAHYDRFRNYVEANTWKEEQRPGTGILYNLGSHMLDQVLVLFGMPQYVDARIGTQRLGGKVDDFYDIRLEYDNLNVIVKSSYLVREQGPRYIVHGMQGSFVKYGLDLQEQDLKAKKTPGAEGWGSESEAGWGKLNTTFGGLDFKGAVKTIPGNYLLFYDNVYDAIRNGKILAVKPEQSRQGIQLIEMCYESNKQKRSIKIQS